MYECFFEVIVNRVISIQGVYNISLAWVDFCLVPNKQRGSDKDQHKIKRKKRYTQSE